MFSDLNESQRAAVYAPDGPLLIVAGAGSGKTKTLTARLAYLIAEQGILPEHILGITFTNKAAGEMRERVEKMLAHNGIAVARPPFLGTFHSFGAWVLRKEAARLGRKPSFSIYDGDDSLRLIRRILKDANLDKTKTPAFFDREFGRIKSELLEREYYLNQRDGELIWNMFQEYEAALTRQNAFDFDDLIEKVVRLFKSHPEVLEKYQGFFTHILIDEYQDVNTSQYVLIRLLGGKYRNVTAVGDDAQAIYKFRFSDFRNFLNFERDWPDARVVFLEQNYRSTKKIIESSSRLISHNVMQKKKNLWTDNDDGASVQVIETDNEFTQAEIIVTEARGSLRAGESVAVLYRTNAQSRAIEQLLLEYNVPYKIYGSVSFYERKEVKDVLAALRFAYNPDDAMSVDRLEKALGKRAFKALRPLIAEGLTGRTPAEFIQFFIERASYAEVMKKDFSNYADRLENLKELIYFAQQFTDVTAFIEKVSLADAFDKQALHQGEAHLQLMTIHIAKGLEFDTVFLAGVNEGILPHQRSLFSSDDLEEERRLMYVAMTRARKRLFVLFYQLPSRFIYELPPEHTYFIGDRSINDEERYITYD